MIVEGFFARKLCYIMAKIWQKLDWLVPEEFVYHIYIDKEFIDKGFWKA